MPCAASPDQIVVTYPIRPGYTLLAHGILQSIGNRFGLSGRLDEDPTDRFSVRFGDTTIFDRKPAAPTEIDPVEILAELGKHAPTVRTKVQTNPSTPDDSEDPDHRQWLNSCCSGE